MHIKKHIWIAATIYLVVMAFFWLKSGDAFTVRLVNSIPLTLGFLAPAVLLVRGVSDFKSRFGTLVAVVLSTLVAYDFLLSKVVVKHHWFDLWFALYPFASILLLSLLFVHATLSRSQG